MLKYMKGSVDSDAQPASVTDHRCSYCTTSGIIPGQASPCGQVRFVEHGTGKLGGCSTWKGAGNCNVKTSSKSAEITARYLTLKNVVVI